MSVLRIISNRLAGRRKTAEINIPLDTAIVIAKSAHDFWDVSFTKGWRSYFGENVSREEAGRF